MHIRVVLEAHHMMINMIVIVPGRVLAMIQEEVQDMIKTTRGIVTMGEALSVLELLVIGDGKTDFLMEVDLMIIVVLTEKVSLKSDRQIAKKILLSPAHLLYDLLRRYWERMLYLFALVSLQEPVVAGRLMSLKLLR